MFHSAKILKMLEGIGSKTNFRISLYCKVLNQKVPYIYLELHWPERFNGPRFQGSKCGFRLVIGNFLLLSCSMSKVRFNCSWRLERKFWGIGELPCNVRACESQRSCIVDHSCRKGSKPSNIVVPKYKTMEIEKVLQKIQILAQHSSLWRPRCFCFVRTIIVHIFFTLNALAQNVRNCAVM